MMPFHRLLVISLPLLLAFSAGCSKPPAALAPTRKPIPAGPLMEDSMLFHYAIYYLPRPSKEPVAELKRLLAEMENAPTLVDAMPETPGESVIAVDMLEDVQKEYTPPDKESLKYFGFGLSAEQETALQASERVLILSFAHGKARVWPGLRAANQVALALARETGGLIWDEGTRQVFTPEAWDKRRIQTWKESLPDIAYQTTIHAYNDGEFVRAITLGMAKVGLPDVVVENSSWSSKRSTGNLINLFCQAIAEGSVLGKPGEYDLDIRKIQTQEVREGQLSALVDKATAVAKLTLVTGEWERGDPENRLIEITFDRNPGKDAHAQQNAAVSSMFGWEDTVRDVKHTDAVKEASERAKAKLPQLRKDFEAGLAPGEYILVKGPFPTPDGGNEWMWVEVTAWQPGKIKGLLNNEPFNIPKLHAGQMVEVKEEDIFDYIRERPDGTSEGNETGAIIDKQ
jgi:uncharacterized protein YegJ (DUF2314 family)